MNWCSSPIPEAIQKAKVQGSMFLVYIYGPDEQSEQMNTVWDNDSVSAWINDSRAVAVRILSTSEECKFFSQIYPVVCVPSTYCIGDGGIPLEVIGGHMSSEEFLDKLKAAQQTHESRKSNQSTSSAAPPESMDVSDPSTSTQVAGSSEAARASGDQASGLSQEEKIARAKDLITQKQDEKSQKEFEKSREEEINRRKLGKDLHKLKQTQQEVEMKELKEQMKKDKEEEKKAREKIKAQIARDREERASKYQKEKQEKDTAAQEAKKAKLIEEQKQAQAAEARKSETARIQVRLPDGSSFTQTYNSSQSLQVLYTTVSEKIGGEVTLSTTFPKHVFTEEELDSSFTDLQLAPSAVVIAMPRRSGRQTTAISGSSPGVGNIFMTIFYPFTLLWSFIYSLFFGGGGGSGEQANQQQQQQQQSSQDRSSQSSARPERPTTAYQRRPQPSGNMRRMTDMRDDDEDMSTYNGNSTQQL